jgi:hypothetical protein
MLLETNSILSFIWRGVVLKSILKIISFVYKLIKCTPGKSSESQGCGALKCLCDNQITNLPDVGVRIPGKYVHCCYELYMCDLYMCDPDPVPHIELEVNMGIISINLFGSCLSTIKYYLLWSWCHLGLSILCAHVHSISV